jgi:hypothetical protein
MPNAQYSTSLSAGGVSIQQSVLRSGDGPIALQTTLAAGKTCTNWVKTDANTAACDLPGGHGYTNGNFTCFWTESSVQKVRYNVPGTISTNALSLDGGAGDDFPVNGTSVVVCKVTVANILIDGDNAEIVGVCAESTDSASTSVAHVLFEDASNDDIAALTLEANEPRIYDIEGGDSNVFTGDIITSAVLANGSASESLTIKVVGIQDATP